MANTPDPSTKPNPPKGEKPSKKPPMKDLPTPEKTGEAVKGGFPTETI